MPYTRTQKIGIVIVVTGSVTCLLLTFIWIASAFYWHSVTGSWLDHHITDHELAPLFCIVGVFFFTRIVGKMFNV
jgi:hypothetical protein